MAHSEKCPVCEGQGNTRDEYDKPDEEPRVCHGCKGKGWIVVHDEPKFVTQIPDMTVKPPEFDKE